MFIKLPPVCWKILGILFTSILAPVGIRHLDSVGQEPTPAEALLTSAMTAPLQKVDPSATRIVAKGSGSTPEIAFQNAMNAALHQAVAAEVSALDWRQHNQAYLASLRQNGTGVLHGWQEVSSTSEHHLTGRVFHSEVAVEVDIAALRTRLHSVDHTAHR